MNKLRPAIGDIWDFHYSEQVVNRFELVYKEGGRWFGRRNGEKVCCLDDESKMLRDDRFVLVRPAGCPEGFVACRRSCGRWSNKDEDKTICWTCAAGGVPCDERSRDWTPPPDRILGAPVVVPPVLSDARPQTTGRIVAEVDDLAFPGGSRKGVFRLVSESARAARRKQGSSARPDYMATVYNEQDAGRLVRLWNDGLDYESSAKEKGAPAPTRPPLAGDVCGPVQGPQRPHADRLDDIDRRLQKLETKSAPGADCSAPLVVSTACTGPCCSPVPTSAPSAQFKACYAVGPFDSRCLRDCHGEDQKHRFGMRLPSL